MDVSRRDPADADRLRALIRPERNATQRDRLRAALLAVEGREAPAIAESLSRSRRFVQRWAYAYRDGGIEALAVKRQPGRPPRLRPPHEAAFLSRIEAGPTQADGGVCTLRGRDAVRILEAEFGVRYSLGGAYDLLHRLNYSCLRPRPRHRKSDPAAQEKFRADAPLLSRR